MAINTKTIKWNNEDLVIKERLTFTEVMTFVESVVSNCFTTADNLYTPEIQTFITNVFIIDMYTDFEMPKNTEEKYEIACFSRLVKIILGHIDLVQLKDMKRAISKKIKSKIEADKTLIRTQIEEILAVLDGLEKQMKVFDIDVSPEEMSSFIEVVSNKNIDEEKIVKSYADNLLKD